jgi:hypothetical protein
MTEIKIGDDLPKDKPYLIIGEEKVIVFDNVQEQKEYLDKLYPQTEIIEDEIVE